MDMDFESLDTTATTIGTGMVVADDGKVMIVIMLGDAASEDMETHRTLATIALEPDVAEMIAGKINALVEDAEQATEAIRTMGIDAAKDYVANWPRRDSAGLN